MYQLPCQQGQKHISDIKYQHISTKSGDRHLSNLSSFRRIPKHLKSNFRLSICNYSIGGQLHVQVCTDIQLEVTHGTHAHTETSIIVHMF